MPIAFNLRQGHGKKREKMGENHVFTDWEEAMEGIGESLARISSIDVFVLGWERNPKRAGYWYDDRVREAIRDPAKAGISFLSLMEGDISVQRKRDDDT